MKYIISKEAINDLEKIWLYTFHAWSVEQADRYVNLLMEEIEHLSLNPKSGRDVSHIIQGYYRSKVKSHFIFYRIKRDSDLVEIIRILHQQMDIKSRLKI